MKRHAGRFLAGLIIFSLPIAVLLASSKDKVAGISHPPAGTDSCPPPWQLAADMPQDLYGGSAASDGTYAYVAGGYSLVTGTTLTLFNRFDPIANTWTPLASLPDAVIMASAVYYPASNKIYVFGGEEANSAVNSNATRIYDIATDTWSAGANMPDVRSFMASGYNSANGKIYLVSGYNTGDVTSAQADTWEYDPVADTFTSRAAFPHPTGGAASGVIDGHLYVAGGRDAAVTVVNLVWDYDIAADTWTAKANMTTTENNTPGSAVALGRLWVYGGGNPFGPALGSTTTAAFVRKRVKARGVPDTTNGATVYDPVTDSWSVAPSLNAQRSFPAGAAIGNELIAAGGYSGSTSIAGAEVMTACVPGEVTGITPTSGPAAGGTSVAISGFGFLGGATVSIGGVAAADVTVSSPVEIDATTPALSPGTLNDVSVTNPIVRPTDRRPLSATSLAKGWLADFLDIPQGDTLHNFVEKIFRKGITAGCGGGDYCRDNPIRRDQMAVFLLKAEHGSSYTPPMCTGAFLDVPCPGTFTNWVERLAAEGITGGCGGGNFCPGNPVTRQQMAVFLLKTEHGSSYVPPACASVFGDVPCPSLFADWIEQLFHENITAGCGGGDYCPGNPNTRGQMAVFIVKTFGF